MIPFGRIDFQGSFNMGLQLGCSCFLCDRGLENVIGGWIFSSLMDIEESLMGGFKVTTPNCHPYPKANPVDSLPKIYRFEH